MDKDGIIERSLELLHESRLTSYFIAGETNLSQSTIANYRTGKTKPTMANANTLISFFNKTDSSGLSTESDNAAIAQTGQPVYDIRISAGHGVGIQEAERVLEWVNIPKFDGCYGVTVFGDSMNDKFKSGDVIFVRTILGRSDFDFGQCYVVITSEDRYIKNIYESSKGDDYITLVSYNTTTNPDGRRKYPDRDIPKDEIVFLYKVVGKLSRDQI